MSPSGLKFARFSFCSFVASWLRVHPFPTAHSRLQLRVSRQSAPTLGERSRVSALLSNSPALTSSPPPRELLFPHPTLSPCPPFLRGKNSPQKNRKNLLDLLLNKTEIPLVCRFRINSLNPTLILHLQPHGPCLQLLSLPRRATLCAPVCWFAWWQRRRSRLEFARTGWGGSPLGIFENERVG
jgi:hypothetical protein